MTHNFTEKALSCTTLTTRHSPAQISSTLLSSHPTDRHARADSRFAPSQWETPLLCSDVSLWLGANLKSNLPHGCRKWQSSHACLLLVDAPEVSIFPTLTHKFICVWIRKVSDKFRKQDLWEEDRYVIRFQMINYCTQFVYIQIIAMDTHEVLGYCTSSIRNDTFQ